MGFDYGRRRIGVATAQTLTGQARALTTLAAVRERPDWSTIADLVAEWEPAGLVVGLPLNADGSEHAVTRAARKFGNRLANDTRLPVYWVDERLSSHAAAERLTTRGRDPHRRHVAEVDAEAACVILETWLAENPEV